MDHPLRRWQLEKQLSDLQIHTLVKGACERARPVVDPPAFGTLKNALAGRSNLSDPWVLALSEATEGVVTVEAIVRYQALRGARTPAAVDATGTEG